MKPLAPALVLASLVGFGLFLIGAREGSTRLRLGPLELDLRVPSLWSAEPEAPPEPGPSAALEGPSVPARDGGTSAALPSPGAPAPGSAGAAVHLAPGTREPLAGTGTDGPGPLSCWEPPAEEARFRHHLELLLGPRLGGGSSESGAALDRLIDIELGLERARRRALLGSPTVS